MIIAATGHRPDKLGGYERDATEKLIAFAEQCVRRHAPDVVISGMALGWDKAVAFAALALKIPLVAALPFRGQEKVWPVVAQIEYHDILSRASKVVYVDPHGYAPWKMQRRNEWMVDSADKILALWNGSAGGTANCIKYARKKEKPIDNAWDDWRNTSD